MTNAHGTFQGANLLTNPAYDRYRVYLVTFSCRCTRHVASTCLAQAASNAHDDAIGKHGEITSVVLAS